MKIKFVLIFVVIIIICSIFTGVYIINDTNKTETKENTQFDKIEKENNYIVYQCRDKTFIELAQNT